MAFGVQRIENGTNNSTKRMAALMAIYFAKSLGISTIHIEGNSLIIINAIIASER